MQKTKHVFCFYNTIFFFCAKKYETKFYAQVYYENFKTTRKILKFFIYQVLTLKTMNLLKNVMKNHILFFIDTTLAPANTSRFRNKTFFDKKFYFFLKQCLTSFTKKQCYNNKTKVATATTRSSHLELLLKVLIAKYSEKIFFSQSTGI